MKELKNSVGLGKEDEVASTTTGLDLESVLALQVETNRRIRILDFWYTCRILQESNQSKYCMIHLVFVLPIRKEQ